MIACLVGASPRLAELAGQFSPIVESIGEDEVVFSIDGLGSLFGNVQQVASEIGRRGADMKITASLAIAANKSTARLAARNYRGVTIIEPGREANVLAEIPVEALAIDPDLIQTLHRWGVETLGAVAALPETGIRERLGEAGSGLRRLALGQGDEVIAVRKEAEDYREYRELDASIEQLEPLLFIVSAQLHGLVNRLGHNGYSALGVELTLTLDGGGIFVRRIELPVATRDPLNLLKQFQFSLDSKPPNAPICAVQTLVLPSKPRTTQHGLFHPAAPQPDKLQILLGRLRGIAGPERVGTPEILNTHRPDAFRMRSCAFEPTDPRIGTGFASHIAFRYFRPPISAQVILRNQLPLRIISHRVTGQVIHAAGPWRTSGGLWTHERWDRDEWDVLVDHQGIYRIYLSGSLWFLDGSYD